MKKQVTSNELIQAMLDQQLEANEIKLVLAYVSLGGWKQGQEVFLPESVIKQYGMNKTTIKRHRKSLMEKGWMTPTGNKSKWGVDMYLISIPAPVQGGPNRTTKVDHSEPRVDQNGLGGGPFWSTEVIKRSNERSNEVSNKEEGSARRASQSSAKASDSTLPENKRIKKNDNTAASGRPVDLLNESYSLDWDSPHVRQVPKRTGVDQIGPPSYETDEAGELVW